MILECVVVRKIIAIIVMGLVSACISPQQARLTKQPMGLTLWRSAARAPGSDLILLTPSRETNPKSFLINLNGDVIKTWSLKRTALNSRIGPDGLLYSLLLAPPERRVNINFGDCDELVAVNSINEEVLSIKRLHMSHDFDFVDRDKIVVFELDRLNRPEIKKIVPKSNLEIAYADRVVVMDLKGMVTWSWAVKDHFQELKTGTLNPDDILLTTANSIQYVPNNPLTQKPAFLASFRNLDAVVLIEYPSGHIIWKSTGSLSRQHDATLTGSKVLVFDNNVAADIPNMRIHQFDLKQNTSSIIWRPPWWNRMTTSVMGGVRRLDNGNLLVSNSVAGNLVEVSGSGELVWSFLLAPETWDRGSYMLGTPFYRAEVYSRQYIGEALMTREK